MKRGETYGQPRFNRLAERAGWSRPQSHFGEITSGEQNLLRTGSLRAIETEQAGIRDLVLQGQRVAPDVPPAVIETIARANVLREAGLYKTWRGYLALDKALMHFMGISDMSQIEVGEFGPGNFTHDAALSMEELRQYQGQHVVGYEKGPQVGISQAAIALHEQAGELPKQGYTVHLSAGEAAQQQERSDSETKGSFFVSGLAIQYDPELTMQKAKEHAANAGAKPAFVGNWDLLHGYFGATAHEIHRGKIAIRPTHPGHGEILGSSILEAELLGQAVETQVVEIGDRNHPEKGYVREEHQTFRHRLQFQQGVNARSSSIIPDYSTLPEGELTVIRSTSAEHAEPKIRLWATHYRENTPREIEQLSRVIEYTVTEMYEKAAAAGKPLDAAGILRQPDLSPDVARHPLRRRNHSVTAVSLLQSESSAFDATVEGYPDITMLGNILMLNIDVLKAMEEKHLLTFAGTTADGSAKYCKSAADLVQQFLAHKEEIRRYGIMTVPNGVAAVSALNAEAAQLMRAA